MKEGNGISICDQPCVLDFEKSLSNECYCRIPSLATSYSVKEFGIEKNKVLTAPIFSSGSSDDTLELSNGKYTNDFSATTSKYAECYFGM